MCSNKVIYSRRRWSTRPHHISLLQCTRKYESIDNAPILLVFPSSCRDDLSEADRSQEALARYQSPITRHGQLRLTSLAVDKGPMQGDGVRLFVSYSNGNSTLLYYNTASNTFHGELHLEKGSSDCIVSSAMHSNLLVTCTIDFRIRLYHINADSPRLIEERRSYCCHWPASLRLEPIDSKAINSQYRLSIAYSSPSLSDRLDCWTSRDYCGDRTIDN